MEVRILHWQAESMSKTILYFMRDYVIEVLVIYI